MGLPIKMVLWVQVLNSLFSLLYRTHTLRISSDLQCDSFPIMHCHIQFQIFTCPGSTSHPPLATCISQPASYSPGIPGTSDISRLGWNSVPMSLGYDILRCCPRNDAHFRCWEMNT